MHVPEERCHVVQLIHVPTRCNDIGLHAVLGNDRHDLLTQQPVCLIGGFLQRHELISPPTQCNNNGNNHNGSTKSITIDPLYERASATASSKVGICVPAYLLLNQLPASHVLLQRVSIQ
jgi:hypothetical protein